MLDGQGRQSPQGQRLTGRLQASGLLRTVPLWGRGSVCTPVPRVSALLWPLAPAPRATPGEDESLLVTAAQAADRPQQLLMQHLNHRWRLDRVPVLN